MRHFQFIKNIHLKTFQSHELIVILYRTERFLFTFRFGNRILKHVTSEEMNFCFEWRIVYLDIECSCENDDFHIIIHFT